MDIISRDIMRRDDSNALAMTGNAHKWEVLQVACTSTDLVWYPQVSFFHWVHPFTQCMAEVTQMHH